MKYFFCILATGITIFSITTPLQAQTIPIGNRQPPPLPSTKEGIDEWKRRYCSIGWREYGMAHIKRCLELTRINPEDVKPSATLSSPPYRRSVNFLRPPKLPKSQKEATKIWRDIGRKYASPGPGWIFDGEYKGKVVFIKILPKRGGRPYYMLRYRDKNGLSPTVTSSVNCKTWEIFTFVEGQQNYWHPIAPNTNGDRKAKKLCAEDVI